MNEASDAVHASFAPAGLPNGKLNVPGCARQPHARELTNSAMPEPLPVTQLSPNFIDAPIFMRTPSSTRLVRRTPSKIAATLALSGAPLFAYLELQPVPSVDVPVVASGTVKPGSMSPS